MTRTIVFTSGKGGVGKSNISLNSALELSRRQYRTCLLDADLGLANVDILLGIHPEKNLDDFLFQDTPIEEIIVRTPYGVDIIPGSSGVEKMANLDSAQLSLLIEAFGRLDTYDFLLIDTASGISQGVVSFCLASCETILILTPEPTSIADGYALLKVLSLNRYQGTVKILVNRCESVAAARIVYVHLKKVTDKNLSINMTPGGTILADSHVEKAVATQKPLLHVFPDCAASQCIRAFVANLDSDAPEEQGIDFRSFWSRLAEFIQADLILPGKSPRTLQSRHKVPAEAVPARQVVPVRGDKLSSARDLPSPTPILSHVLKMKSCGRLSLSEARKIIATDPALICRFLHAHHLLPTALTGGVDNLEQVIEELGEEYILNTLTSLAIHALVDCSPYNSSPLLYEQWAHNYRCGMLAEALAEMVKYPFPGEAYLAGILHDVGRLVLRAHLSKNFLNAMVSSAQEGTLGFEEKIAGQTHTELGAEILSKWRLSSCIIDSARYHLEPEERIGTALDLVKLVSLAHKFSSPAETERSAALELAMRFFKLPSSQIITCLSRIEQNLVLTARQYEMPQGDALSEQEQNGLVWKYKQQAVDHALLQYLLPTAKPACTVSSVLRTIHHGMNILFGLRKVVCLLPDANRLHLQATGYPLCFGSEWLEHIQFSLSSPKSVVVSSFHTCDLGISQAKDLQSLADKQLLDILQSDGLICVPLAAAEINRGVVVCGYETERFSEVKAFQKRFEQFGFQVALSLNGSQDGFAKIDRQGDS